VERISNLIIDDSHGVYMTDPIGVSPPFFFLFNNHILVVISFIYLFRSSF